MAPKFPVTVDSIRRAIVKTVGTRVCAADELAETINNSLETDLSEDDVLDFCEDIIELNVLDTGEVFNVQNLIRQLTFTHRVTQREAEQGRVEVDVDLAHLRSTVPEFFEPGNFDEATEFDPARVPLLRHEQHQLVWTVTYPDELDDELDGNDDKVDDTDDDSFDDDPIQFVEGPHNWLKDKAGSLIGFRLADDNVWDVEENCTIENNSTSSSMQDSFAEALTAVVESMNESVRLGVDVLYELVDVIEWDMFTGGFPALTISPLIELLPKVGLISRNLRISRAGTDWETDTDRRMLRQLAIVWDVPFASVDAHAMINGGRLVMHAMRTINSEDASQNHEKTDEDLEEFRAALRTDHVARLLASHHEDSRLDDPTGELILFLNELRPGATRTDHARIDWVLSRIVADPLQQVDYLRAALKADHRFVPALEDHLFAAACMRDINEFRNAMSSWADVEIDAGVRNGIAKPTARQSLRFSMLQPNTAPVRVAATAGRNDPCPCGSGKKFKQCHLGKRFDDKEGSSNTDLSTAGTVDALTLNELFALLAAWFDMNQPEVLNDINTMLRMRLSDEQLVGTSLFVLDAAVAWETNVDEFVSLTSARGRRWTANEMAAIRQSCHRPVSVFEVHDRAVGRSLMLRDLMSGELMVVDAPDSSKGFEIGEYLLARVVGTIANLRFGQGAIGIPMRDRDATMTWLAEHNQRPNAVLLCMWVLGRVGRFTTGSSMTAGPVRHNTSGEVLQFHNVRIAVESSLDEINARLLATKEVQSLPEELSNGFGWSIIDGTTLVAQIYVWAEELTDATYAIDFDVNSTERFERVLAILLSAFPTAQVVAHTIDDPDDLRLTSEMGLRDERAVRLEDEDDEPFDPTSFSDDDRQRFSIALEQQWFAEHIPALGGLTPRQAADDPTRRSDLIKLLRQMDGPISGPISIGYDARRMADELGVDIGPQPKNRPRLPGIH
jgi:uncharacterized protein YchJ